MRFASGLGPADETTPRVWSGAEKAAFVLFTAAVFGSLAFTVHPWYDLKSADAGLYFTTARSIAAGEGYALHGIPFTLRVPGFSLLLAPVVGTAEPDFFAINLWVGVFGATTVVLLALFQRNRLGWPLALFTALAVWTNPGYQRLCNQLLSDVPGVAFVFGCLLVDRWATRAPSWRREIALGLCLGVAISVRSVAMLLWVAIAVSRVLAYALSRSPVAPGWRDFALQRLVIFALAAFLLVLPISIRNRALAPQPPVDQTGFYSYWTAMWHEDPGDPESPRLGLEEILERTPTRVQQTVNSLGSRIQTSLATPERIPVTLLLLAGLLTVLVRRRAPAEFFGFGVLLLLLVYFDLRERLLLPVYLVALPATVEMLRDLGRRFSSLRAANLAVAALLAVLVGVDFAPRQGWSEMQEKHDAFNEICSAVQWALDSDARVATAFNWHYATCLDRPVYTLLFAVRRAEDPAAAEAVIDAYGINTVILTPFWLLDRALFPYFKSRYADVKHVGNAYVFRVRP